MPSLKDIFDAVLRILLGTRAFSSGAIAIGTTKSKIKTAAAINYCIAGVLHAVAATDDLFVFTDVAPQADGTTKYYALCLDAAGAASIVSGTATALPKIADTLCLVGYVKIVTDGAAFVPGTTLLDAATVTATYVNVSCAPLVLA